MATKNSISTIGTEIMLGLDMTAAESKRSVTINMATYALVQREELNELSRKGGVQVMMRGIEEINVSDVEKKSYMIFFVSAVGSIRHYSLAMEI